LQYECRQFFDVSELVVGVAALIAADLHAAGVRVGTGVSVADVDEDVVGFAIHRRSDCGAHGGGVPGPDDWKVEGH